MRRLILGWLLLPLLMEATVLSGTFKYPDESAVNGTLEVGIRRPGIRSTCTGRIVPSQFGVSVANGVIQGTIDLSPTDCLNRVVMYDIRLSETDRTILFQHLWYVGAETGVLLDPATGNQFIRPTNVGLFGTKQTMLNVSLYSTGRAGYKRTKKDTGSMAPSAVTTFVVKWRGQFAGTNYTAACTVIDLGDPEGSPQLEVTALSGKTIAEITVEVTNNDGGGAHSGRIYCQAHLD